jgi:CubicO group peptidase (beta-lactamase class C family)
MAGRSLLRWVILTAIAAAGLELGGRAAAFPTAARSAAAASVTPGAPWVARHGLTSDEYQAEFDAWVGQGYRLTYVSGYEVNGTPLFAAIWEQSAGPAWIARHAMSAAEYQQEFDRQVAAGYRLVLVNGYAVGGVDRYVAIWEQSAGPAWIARHGMTAAEYQQEFDRQVAAGYRLVHVSGYEVAGQATYAAIWEQSAGPAWLARHGMTAAEYQQAFDEELAAGYRLLHVSGYTVSGSTQYAAIWEQSPSLAWMAFHGVPGESYQQKFDDLTRQGYRPAQVDGYAVAGGGAQLAGIFYNDLASIDRVARDAMAKLGLPALSLAISKDGRLVFAKAYGLADQAADTPADTSSLFRIASVSKPITSVAIQRLVEQGALGLDDRVFGPGGRLGTLYGAHWNDTPLPTAYQALQQVTIRHLLTHTAGGWQNDGTDPMFTNPTMSQGELITWTLDHLPLANAPGTRWAYSNFGYCVLGRVIEAVTGQRYADWVKANVLDPVGARDMTIAGDTLASRAPGEVVYYSSSENPYGMQVSRMDSHGGWLATPTDLVRLAVRVDGFPTKPDILGAATITTMTTPWAPGEGYAMGWAVNGLNNWWHDGSLPGTRSILVRTAGGFTWAAVTNTRDGAVDLDPFMWDVVNSVTAWPSYDLF